MQYIIAKLFVVNLINRQRYSSITTITTTTTTTAIGIIEYFHIRRVPKLVINELIISIFNYLFISE